MVMVGPSAAAPEYRRLSSFTGSPETFTKTKIILAESFACGQRTAMQAAAVSGARRRNNLHHNGFLSYGGTY
jgi:hypothetical protein